MDLAASECTAAGAVLLHVHDEARLRLRYTEPEGGGATKTRGANVQCHVCSLRVGTAPPLEIYRNLDALANKRAVTVATCLERVVREVGKAVGDAVPDGLLTSHGGHLGFFCSPTS